MADRVLCISWGNSVRGREERGLEVFDEALGLYGRMQQDGRIERFDVVLLAPNGRGPDGYIELFGSAQQLAAVKEDAEFQRVLADARLVVDDLAMVDGFASEGVAGEVERYRAAIGKVPQMSA